MSKGYRFGGFDVTNSVFAESNGYLAMYNIAPIVLGHVLIVPEKLVASLNDLSEDELASFFSFSRKVTKFVVREFKATGFDWTIQDGVSAGQTVSHLHLHIIPRVEGDFESPGDWYPAFKKSVEENIDSEKRERFSEEEMKKVVSSLCERWNKLESLI
ncbi:MAG: HIT family protein [Candidatus Nomurabacteria bacterium]|nr:HIT family protein [Candidatus Nomurabacteria bacterium]USN87679.1 MAG: HIT family protein [Candidatus Nomurabacteria bacterium]